MRTYEKEPVKTFSRKALPQYVGARVGTFLRKGPIFMFDILLSASAYALIIVVGAVCSHTGFIKSETKNVFSALALQYHAAARWYPLVGFQFDASFLLVSAVSFAATVVGFGGAMLFTRRRKPEDRMIPTLMGFGYNIGCFALPFISSVRADGRDCPHVRPWQYDSCVGRRVCDRAHIHSEEANGRRDWLPRSHHAEIARARLLPCAYRAVARGNFGSRNNSARLFIPWRRPTASWRCS